MFFARYCSNIAMSLQIHYVYNGNNFHKLAKILPSYHTISQLSFKALCIRPTLSCNMQIILNN